MIRPETGTWQQQQDFVKSMNLHTAVFMSYVSTQKELDIAWTKLTDEQQERVIVMYTIYRIER